MSFRSTIVGLGFLAGCTPLMTEMQPLEGGAQVRAPGPISSPGGTVRLTTSTPPPLMSLRHIFVTPGPTQNRQVLTLTTSLTVAFRGPPPNSHLYWSSRSHGRRLVRYTKENLQLTTHKGLNTYYATLRDLHPGEVYYIVVGNEQGATREYKVETVASGRPLWISAAGDSRTIRNPRQNGFDVMGKLRSHFLVFAGDMIVSSYGNLWMDWFDDLMRMNRDGWLIPIVPAIGNHESPGDLFNLFPPVPIEEYYFLRAGSLGIFVMNSEISITGNQKSWLTRQLSLVRKPWTIATWHQPMEPCVAGKIPRTRIRDNWFPALESAGAQLIFEGDTHADCSSVEVTYDSNSQRLVNANGCGSGPSLVGQGGLTTWAGRTLISRSIGERYSRRFESNFKQISVSGSQMNVHVVDVKNPYNGGAVAQRFTLPTGLPVSQQFSICQ